MGKTQMFINRCFPNGILKRFVLLSFCNIAYSPFMIFKSSILVIKSLKAVVSTSYVRAVLIPSFMVFAKFVSEACRRYIAERQSTEKKSWFLNFFEYIRRLFFCFLCPFWRRYSEYCSDILNTPFIVKCLYIIIFKDFKVYA